MAEDIKLEEYLNKIESDLEKVFDSNLVPKQGKPNESLVLALETDATKLTAEECSLICLDINKQIFYLNRLKEKYKTREEFVKEKMNEAIAKVYDNYYNPAIYMTADIIKQKIIADNSFLKKASNFSLTYKRLYEELESSINNLIRISDSYKNLSYSKKKTTKGF